MKLLFGLRRLGLFALLIWGVHTSLWSEAPPTPPTPDSGLLPLQEELPAAGMPVSYGGAFAKMMLTLFGLILLIVLSVWMLRRLARGRFSQMNQGRMIKILERRPLSAKSILYVVEVGSKKVLIAESQLEVRAVASVDDRHPYEDE